MKQIRYKIYQQLVDGLIGFDQADKELKSLFIANQEISDEQMKKILLEAKREWIVGKKKNAVKIIRMATGMRLKKCKEYCEQHF